MVQAYENNSSMPYTEADPTVILPLSVLDEMQDNERVFGYKEEDIQAIADEIKGNGFHGFLEVVENRLNPGRYIIVSGHQRKLALESLGIGTAPCHILRGMTDLQIRDLWRSENILHRKQTTYRMALLVDTYDRDYKENKLRGGKDNYVSSKMHIGTTQVKRLRVLLEFPDDILKRCDNESFPHTVLLKAKDFNSDQMEMLSNKLKQWDIDHPRVLISPDDLRKIIEKIKEDTKEKEYDNLEKSDEYEVYTGRTPDGANAYVEKQRAAFRDYYEDILLDMDEVGMQIIDKDLQNKVDDLYRLLNDGKFMTANRITANRCIYGLEKILKMLTEKDGY